MKIKNGFTLIELLAVIVILAIIALIAVPIVLNIIAESKESATLRSADFYLDAVELSLAQAKLNNKNITDGTYNIKNGDICLNETCTDILEVEVNGETPISGKIAINSGNISSIELNYKEGKTIVKNSEGKLVYQEASTCPTLPNCELKEGTEKVIGAKYECDFGDGKRNFYILELGSNKVEGSTLKNDEVALILEGNYDTTTQLLWCASGNNNSCNADGLTSKLDEIAEAWKELEREQIVLPSALQVIVANDPSKNTLDGAEGIQSWLYNWPDNADYCNGPPYGYWTSTPFAFDSSSVWYVGCNGKVSIVFFNASFIVVHGDGYGVRPVVNLKI